MTTSTSSPEQAFGDSKNAPNRASGARTGSLFGSVVCRAIVPAWLFTGALVKLLDGTPALLPKPVRAIYTWMANQFGMGAEADLTRFFDVALRATISMEFMLAAAMVLLATFSRALAALVLMLFVGILTSVVISGDASCGCFGSKGPPPIVVLIIDATMLACVLYFKPRQPQTQRTGTYAGAWIGASAFALAITFGMPAKMLVQAQPDQGASALPKSTQSNTAAAGTNATTSATTPTTISATTPTTTSATTPTTTSANAWPMPPAQLQPYYMPQIEQWIGKPLRSQPLAALIQQPLPSNLEQGRWIVMIFRKDCEHCHEVLQTHFMVKLPAPTLLISIPDTNPASELPNPCSDCIETAFIKGPEYVVGTPILLSLENGIVKRVCINSEDRASLEATLQFR